MKIDNTIEAFFALIRGGLWEQEVSLSGFEEIDYDRILRLAEDQAVVGLVTAGLEQVADLTVPKDVVLRFVGQTLQLERQNKAMNEFVEKLINQIRGRDVYALLLKGQGVAQCYAKPLWRACGDVDLFLSDDNYNKAKDVLTSMGQVTEPEEVAKKHFAMQIGTWAVELHGTLHSGLSLRVDRVLDEVQKDVFLNGNVRSWINGRTQVFLPGVNCDAVYVFSHILQHFYKGGIGLRQICDWCRFLWTYKDSLNRGVLESRLVKMGLISEWKTFACLAVDFLGMPAPAMPLYSDKKKWKRKALRILSFIMKVGNFGHNRDLNYYNRKSYYSRKFISAWRRLKDMFRHVAVFPLDSFRFMGGILYNGVVSTIRGE